MDEGNDGRLLGGDRFWAQPKERIRFLKTAVESQVWGEDRQENKQKENVTHGGYCPDKGYQSVEKGVHNNNNQKSRL